MPLPLDFRGSTHGPGRRSVDRQGAHARFANHDFGLPELEGDERAVPLPDQPRWHTDERSDCVFYRVHEEIVSWGTAARGCILYPDRCMHIGGRAHYLRQMRALVVPAPCWRMGQS